MTVVADKVLVELQARVDRYNANINAAERNFSAKMGTIQSRATNMSAGVTRAFGAVGRAFGAMGIALTTSSIISMTSAWTDLNSRVNNAAGSIERGAAVMGRLSEMARRTYSSLEQTAEAYLGNQQALQALGYSTQQQLDLVETLNNSLVISATRGQQAQSVMDAWSKAMAAGSLRGDNLNTIIQSGGRLSKALADSMGISVNELRKWGEQGKITTDVMFGVTNQLQTLRDEADAMPATVSDGFVLLRDAVFKFVGEADAAAGSSTALAEAILAIANAIDRMPQEGWFDSFFRGQADALVKDWENTRREIEAIARAIEWLQKTNTKDFFESLLDPSRATAFISDFDAALSQVEDSWRRVANEAYNATSGELQSQIGQIIEGINNETLAADEAAKKLAELATSHPEQEPFISIMQAWTDSLYAVRDGALAAAQGMSDIGYMPSMRQIQAIFGPDLSNDGAPGGPIKPPVTSRGGGGASPAQRFGTSLADFQQRIDALTRETEVMRTLNPLVEDYGYAIEKARAEIELENAARKAGIELGPKQREEIERLSESYARATADAARLAEAQGLMKQSFDDLQSAARSALDSIIDGFIEGKDAGEIFNSVLKDLAKNLLRIGLNLIGGGMGGGGFNPLSILFGGFRANGGPVSAGTSYIVGERGPELFTPATSGVITPNGVGAQPVALTVHVVSDDEKFSAYVTDKAGQVVAQASPAIVAGSVRQSNKTAPSAIAQFQQQQFGADYRTM